MRVLALNISNISWPLRSLLCISEINEWAKEAAPNPLPNKVLLHLPRKVYFFQAKNFQAAESQQLLKNEGNKIKGNKKNFMNLWKQFRKETCTNLILGTAWYPSLNFSLSEVLAVFEHNKAQVHVFLNTRKRKGKL